MAESSSELGPAPEMPAEGKKRPWMKLVAVLVAVIVIIVAVAAWYLSQAPVTPPPENRAPTIQSVSADKGAADINAAISFTATATDADGDALTYSWDFGDNTTATGAQVQHQYAFAGNFIAIVTVSDGKVDVASDAKPVFAFVNPAANPQPTAPGATPKPAAVLSASANTIQSGQSVTLNANSSWTWAWTGAWEQQFMNENATAIPLVRLDFGDGTSVSGNVDTDPNIGHKAHTYTTVGSFLVKLSVSNYLGQQDAVGYTIRVTSAAPPIGIVKNPDIFTDVQFGEPEYLDPALDYESRGNQIIQNVAETLIWYEGANVDVLKPMLATKVPDPANPADVSPDGLTWNFTLRPNVRFHYGTDTVNCRAVEFSIKRVLYLNDVASPAWILDQSLTGYAEDDPATPNVDERAVAIEQSVTCPDGPTGLKVQFHLVVPYPAFLFTLAYTVASVIDPNPAAYSVTSVCPSTDLNASYCNDQIVGTGPFKLRVWQPNQQIILDRFDNYWGPVANFREVHIVKANDVQTRVLMLKAGDADRIDLPFNHKDDIRAVPGTQQFFPGITEYTGPTFIVQFIGFNQLINITGRDPNTDDVPPDFFADVNVRKAFVHLWRYQDFINNVVYGYGEQLCGPVPKGMFGYDPTVPCYNTDLAKARQFLQAADDVRTGPPDSYWQNGFKMTMYYNIGNTVREEGSRQMKTLLEAFNAERAGMPPFQITVQGLEWPTFLSYVNAHRPAIFFLGWAPDYADPDDYVVPFLHSNGFYPGRVSYSNTTLDGLIEQQAQELDETTRLNLLKEIQRAPYYDVPYLWLYQSKNLDAMRIWVTGYYSNPMTTAGTGLYYYDLDK